MTAPTRSTLAIFASTSIAPGGSKAVPSSGGTGPWVDIRALNGGQIGWSVKNGASAPGVQGQFTLQVSDANDGTNITDLWSGGGDTTANSETTGLVDLPNTASYARMLCYGNTVNAVTFKSVLFGKD